MSSSRFTSHDIASALQWYVDIGWDEAILPDTQNRLAEKELRIVENAPLFAVAVGDTHRVPRSFGAAEAKESISALVAGVTSLEVLREVVMQFNGFAIRKNCDQHGVRGWQSGCTVDGNRRSPDAEDDKIGRHFPVRLDSFWIK